MKRVKDKIAEIETFLDELKGFMPDDFKDYKSDTVIKAACERYVEKIIEAAVDLSFLIIKQKNFRIPQDDIDAFNILLSERVIDKDLAARLRDAKGMRNIIAHQYGEIDDKIVFYSLKEKLEKDVREFIKKI
ncbi:MAG TPA: DUF86 domain-containing protein [Candidatus Nanoarchaeia archaeon]|nr:DUF86 domain-containing protein [Candidatus Nanoarchaeia archaeon]